MSLPFPTLQTPDLPAFSQSMAIGTDARGLPPSGHGWLEARC
ncbi:hypothetical protein [Luteolibacter sp. LG18]